MSGASRLRSVHGVTVLSWPAIEAAGAEAVVTSRQGGVSGGPYRSLNLGLHVGDAASDVVENWRRAAAVLGARLGDLVVANQVHGRAVAVVGAAQRGRGASGLNDVVGDADVLVTTDPAAVLVTLVADCVPLVLVHGGAGVLATVHAGWRGTVAGSVPAALAAMAALGAGPGGVTAAIGPAISAARYQVGDDVARSVRATLGAAADGWLEAAGPGRWRLDLVAANRAHLLAGGVGESAIVTSGLSTDDADLFFSDRAARPCGRFGLLARLRH